MRHTFESFNDYFFGRLTGGGGVKKGQGCVPFNRLFDLQQTLKDGTQRACKLAYIFWGVCFS
jgi:hypothetical protein